MADQEERLSGALQEWSVYFLHALRNDRLIYIGRAQNPQRRKTAFENRSGIKVRIARLLTFTSLEEACYAEREAIRENEPPWNKKITSTRGMIGKTQSEETRQKISAALVGHQMPEEAKAKLRASIKGRPSNNKGHAFPEASKEILRQKALGRGHSPETRALLSAQRKGKPSPLKGRKIGPHKNKRKSHAGK